MGKQLAEQESVSFYPRERAVIQRVRDRYGLGKSAALQFIINDWAADKGFAEQVHPEEIRQPRKGSLSIDKIAGLRKGVTA